MIMCGSTIWGATVVRGQSLGKRQPGTAMVPGASQKSAECVMLSANGAFHISPARERWVGPQPQEMRSEGTLQARFLKVAPPPIIAPALFGDAPSWRLDPPSARKMIVDGIEDGVTRSPTVFSLILIADALGLSLSGVLAEAGA